MQRCIWKDASGIRLVERREAKYPPLTIMPLHLREIRRKARRQLKANMTGDTGADPWSKEFKPGDEAIYYMVQPESLLPNLL